MRRDPAWLWCLFTSIHTACALASCAWAQTDGLRVKIDVHPDRVVGPISPYVFGAGIDAKTNPLRFPKYPEQVLRDIAESGLRIARFPGGFVFNDECRQKPPPRLIVGEWSGDWTGAIFRQHENSFRGSMMRTMASAVFLGDLLMFMMEKSVVPERIHAAFWHAFCNDAQALFSIQTTQKQGIAYKGESTDEGYGYRMPVYWVFKLLSEQRGESLVASELRGENTVDAPADGLYTDPEYTFQRVTHCASRTGDKLYLALLNKDARQSVAVGITTEDWQMKPSMQVYEVGAESYLAENTVEQPDRVTLSGPTTQTVPAGGELTYSLEPNTLAVLRFRREAVDR